MSFCHIYITRAARAITRVLFVPSVILYNNSVNKKLILCYILNAILSVFVLPTKILPIKPQQNCCASPSNTAVFSLWMNLRFERIEWINDSKPIHKERHWLCSKCHTIILLLLFQQYPVSILCIVCTFSACMEYPDDLLYLPESAKHNSGTLKSSCVRNGILPHNSYYIEVCCVYTVNSMWIFCMHGMPGLTATFAEFWCMHLKTLHGILFPRTQRTPCDVSSSNAWVNWRRGIVIINVTLLYVRTVYIHVKYKLSLCI